MRTLSTGQPSTLGSYAVLARFISNEALLFIEKKIMDSPNGAEEEVIADEGQMLILLASMSTAKKD